MSRSCVVGVRDADGVEVWVSAGRLEANRKTNAVIVRVLLRFEFMRVSLFNVEVESHFIGAARSIE